MARALGLTFHFVVLVVIGFLLLFVGGWGVLAIHFAGPANDLLRNGLAGTFAILTVGAFIGLFLSRWRWRVIPLHAFFFLAVLGWWQGIEPSNDRPWQPDVAKLAYADIQGDLVTVHNIRNLDYQSEAEYRVAYYDKTFDLTKLVGVDLISVYWMGPEVAHVFLSFDFGNNDHLAISIETRKEEGENYSTTKGFFRQYELYYVVADERDVIGLRTNYRKNPPEDVYVYRTKGSLEGGRRMFLAYINRMNELKEKPEFYNTLTTNCTTSIWMSSRVNQEHVPFSWKILASGFIPEYLYEQGRLKTGGLAFPELQKHSLINAKAQAADKAADFSQQIRLTNVNESGLQSPKAAE